MRAKSSISLHAKLPTCLLSRRRATSSTDGEACVALADGLRRPSAGRRPRLPNAVAVAGYSQRVGLGPEGRLGMFEVAKAKRTNVGLPFCSLS